MKPHTQGGNLQPRGPRDNVAICHYTTWGGHKLSLFSTINQETLLSENTIAVIVLDSLTLLTQPPSHREHSSKKEHLLRHLLVQYQPGRATTDLGRPRDQRV
jgi:hypothetical protein